jgi:glycosyltransferase involved in cell wall biosynthesis
VTTLSIIVPCYNEEKSLPLLIAEMDRLFKNLPHEVIIVDDGSRDATFAVAFAHARSNKNLKVIKLSRNFGHQMASSAGLDHAKGEMVALIDADLQDPPAVILQMMEKAIQGHDVVYGKRLKRKGESIFKKVSAYVFYRAIRYLSKVDIPVDTGDFRLMNRKVVEALKSMPERERFLRGMISWLGFNQTHILYERNPRKVGSTAYNFQKMVKFAIDGITSFSTFPLRAGSYLGILTGLLSILLIAYQIYNKIYYGTAFVRGWTSIVTLILGTSSVQFFLMGIQGEYLARIFEESKARPKYIIDQKFNFD